MCRWLPPFRRHHREASERFAIQAHMPTLDMNGPGWKKVAVFVALVSLGPGTFPFHWLLQRGTAPGTAVSASHSRQCSMGQKRCCCPKKSRQARPVRTNRCHRPSLPNMEFPGKSCAWSAGCQRPEAGFLAVREQSGWPAQEKAVFSGPARTAGNRALLQTPALPQGYHPSLFHPPRLS